MLKAADSAVPVACWSCSVAHNDSILFCPHCSKIQPPPGGDFFRVFGLEPRLDLDVAALEREFHRLSRKVHPDRFARSGENERQWSLADTALLNDAYRTLKDPLRRTEYLLKLRGAEAAEDQGIKNRKEPSRVPADLLEEVFEFNMQLEQMRAECKADEADPELRADIERAKLTFGALLDDVDRELCEHWRAWDNGDDAVRVKAEASMLALLDRRRYLSNLVRDAGQALGAE